MPQKNRKEFVNSTNLGHRKRIKVLIEAEWRCTCAWCGLGKKRKCKSSRIKKHGRIRRIKPPWKQ